MITRTTPKPKLPKPQPLCLLLPISSSSSVTPSPHPHQKGSLSPVCAHLHNSNLPTTAIIATKTNTQDKKEKARQYNKAHREKLKRNGRFEEHKERVRQYNAKRRQTLNTMAKENGLSVRKMAQTLKETKENTGVDLLSIAINSGDDQSNDETKEVVTNTPVPTTPQLKVDVHNAVTTPKSDIHAAQAYLAQRCQPTQTSPSLSPLPTPPTSKEEETKNLTKVVATANTVITPSTIPPGGIAAPPIAAPVVENEDQKKSKHNEHNRAYRDKLKQDKRRYEEHKEKARQYNEKRRKKLRAMAKETGLTMKETEQTIKEAKIISALTMTASKEAEKSIPFSTPHLIGVSPPPQAAATNCLDILSDAASIVLSQSHHHQQQRHQHTRTLTPPSPRRQHRTVSEDNYDSSLMEVNSY